MADKQRTREPSSFLASQPSSTQRELSYYPGCTAHSTAWEFNESTEGVFRALGWRLRELPDWNCCGGASAHTMDRVVGLGLPARNLAIAQRMGRDVLVPCAGCYNNVQKARVALEAGDPDARKIEDTLGFRWGKGVGVLSLLDWLERPGVIEALKAGVKRPLQGLKVVAYYGCQLVRPPRVTGRRSWENPTTLERACEAVGAQALDWSYKVDCCGADLGITHPDRAEALCSGLVARAREAGAQAVVVSCGLCQANLDMRQKGQGLPVLYVTELLGAALGVPGREKWWKKHLVDPSPLFR
ncbi:CoB--CoM heterodisulfide reductase iron-sulfur subunit B family protein [Deferrisoma camini]|uniref:CoB--CoM heterodisulfide reductase iron-sulfur subunit B family protein n=1 Tax=Deferrisoma camini TaxID=1035120 RepID=UPI00046C95DA|nr:CoB--CoM heterodisulfide reductase iron-sulfur subunit B family protein [Deferrisoma camini]